MDTVAPGVAADGVNCIVEEVAPDTTQVMLPQSMAPLSRARRAFMFVLLVIIEKGSPGVAREPHAPDSGRTKRGYNVKRGTLGL
jgi:hypothetical protein